MICAGGSYRCNNPKGLSTLFHPFPHRLLKKPTELGGQPHLKNFENFKRFIKIGVKLKRNFKKSLINL